MGFWDKLFGRSKKTETEVAGDTSMPGEGTPQQQEGMAGEPAASAEEMAQRAPESAEEPRTEPPAQ